MAREREKIALIKSALAKRVFLQVAPWFIKDLDNEGTESIFLRDKMVENQKKI